MNSIQNLPKITSFIFPEEYKLLSGETILGKNELEFNPK